MSDAPASAGLPMTTGVAVRFDSSEIGQQFTEIVAYGTVVKVDRVV